MRFSTWFNLTEHTLTKARPSSKRFIMSSSGNVPASISATIVSSRSKASSNPMSPAFATGSSVRFLLIRCSLAF